MLRAHWYSWNAVPASANTRWTKQYTQELAYAELRLTAFRVQPHTEPKTIFLKSKKY